MNKHNVLVLVTSHTLYFFLFILWVVLRSLFVNNSFVVLVLSISFTISFFTSYFSDLLSLSSSKSFSIPSSTKIYLKYFEALRSVLLLTFSFSFCLSILLSLSFPYHFLSSIFLNPSLYTWYFLILLSL